MDIYSDVRHRLWCASIRILPLGGYFDGGFNFGVMCRYSDVSRLRWRNLQFDNDGNLELTFDHGGRKNS